MSNGRNYLSTGAGFQPSTVSPRYLDHFTGLNCISTEGIGSINSAWLDFWNWNFCEEHRPSLWKSISIKTAQSQPSSTWKKIPTLKMTKILSESESTKFTTIPQYMNIGQVALPIIIGYYFRCIILHPLFYLTQAAWLRSHAPKSSPESSPFKVTTRTNGFAANTDWKGQIENGTHGCFRHASWIPFWRSQLCMSVHTFRLFASCNLIYIGLDVRISRYRFQCIWFMYLV